MADIRWSLTAGADLQQVEDFIARDSALHAVGFIDRLIESAEKLKASPNIGRVVPEFNRPELREVLFRGYRVVYLSQPDAVTILRVVHGARDLAQLARNEPWNLE